VILPLQLDGPVDENSLDQCSAGAVLPAASGPLRGFLEKSLADDGCAAGNQRGRHARSCIVHPRRVVGDSEETVVTGFTVLDRQSISDNLLRKKGEGRVGFDTAIGTLKAFSLITEERRGAVFGMHRLVQLSMQWWLKRRDVDGLGGPTGKSLGGGVSVLPFQWRVRSLGGLGSYDATYRGRTRV
jgi:hypothetical protein